MRRSPLVRRKGLRRNKRRDPAAREFQAAVLARDPRCPCGREATVAHHLPGARSTGKRYHDDIREGLGLCWWCHEEIDHGEQTFFRKWGLDERGHRED